MSAATYDDLLRVPPHLAAGIIDGRRLTHPRPGPKHALADSSLGDDGAVKLPIDACECVSHAWLIDPELRTVETFALEDGRWMRSNT